MFCYWTYNSKFSRESQVLVVPLVQQVYRVNQGYQDMMVYRDVLAKLGLKGIQVSQEILESQDPMGCQGKKVIVVPVCLQWAWEWVRMSCE